jgi:hypothetical protein
VCTDRPASHTLLDVTWPLTCLCKYLRYAIVHNLTEFYDVVRVFLLDRNYVYNRAVVLLQSTELCVTHVGIVRFEKMLAYSVLTSTVLICTLLGTPVTRLLQHDTVRLAFVNPLEEDTKLHLVTRMIYRPLRCFILPVDSQVLTAVCKTCCRRVVCAHICM